MRKRRIAPSSDADAEAVEALRARALDGLPEHRRALGAWLDVLDRRHGAPSVRQREAARALIDELYGDAGFGSDEP